MAARAAPRVAEVRREQLFGRDGRRGGAGVEEEDAVAVAEGTDADSSQTGRKLNGGIEVGAALEGEAANGGEGVGQQK